MASQWAPHRRARGEIHKVFESVTADLDSMPMKEMKKVLTDTVLKGDREAIRQITKKIQTEETWKLAWKQMEAQRREETKLDMEHRMAYNAMLMELAGQPGRKHNPRHEIPNNCTPRLEELAKPVPAKLYQDITKRTDYAGLLHADNPQALEARFPGAGYQLAAMFREEATEKAQGGWPPPERIADPPDFQQTSRRSIVQMGSVNLDDKAARVRTGTVPVCESRMHKIADRKNGPILSDHAVEQVLPTHAPPAPDQGRQALKQVVANDPVHMSQELPSRSDHTSRSLDRSQASLIDVPPPQRQMIYPVAVDTVEAKMERPNWRPKRQHGALASATPREVEYRSHGGRWPPIGTQTVNVTIVASSGLPCADRAGHSDPYAVCQVEGKPRSRMKTQVIHDTEKPVWNKSFVVKGWREGEPLIFSVLDHDLAGQDDVLAAVQVPSGEFYPKPFHGRIDMQNVWVPDDKVDVDFKRNNLACRPKIEVKISVNDDVVKSVTPRGKGQDDIEEELLVSMPGVQPNVCNVCCHLDDFDAKNAPVPRLGNFWMSPR
eukprot:TRINITY_DN35717_c0_g1_i1.p1 TRINITY_DN35717_c0_g1~~TRINITY_DN35717_c0_g1_i1.p1  ORF type:complete len:624 (+),score=91.91 TRINITY_DN35717_c0_g1_i1:231-1874(+)